MSLVDLHTHVLPGVDDGARDVAEAVEALRALAEQGAEIVVATPHFRASRLERPGAARDRLARLDEAHAALEEAKREAGIALRVERGCELRLDAPEIDLSDARLRLAGGSYVLVEFATFQVPPYAGNQLRALVERGWTPVLAHPERYAGIREALGRVERWRDAGVRLQVNAGALGGRYGPAVGLAARELFSRGWVDLVASDYHARGAPALSEEHERLSEAADREVADRLLAENPARALAGEPTAPVPAIELPEAGGGARRGWFR